MKKTTADEHRWAQVLVVSFAVSGLRSSATVWPNGKAVPAVLRNVLRRVRTVGGHDGAWPSMRTFFIRLNCYGFRNCANAKMADPKQRGANL